jgi:hypothetical protein
MGGIDSRSPAGVARKEQQFGHIHPGRAEDERLGRVEHAEPDRGRRWR